MPSQSTDSIAPGNIVAPLPMEEVELVLFVYLLIY